MRLARVTGTVTATVKEPGLTGMKLLVVDVEDGSSSVLQRSLVAADAAGAGVGDMVLLVEGSAARLASNAASLPIDAAIVAVIDHVELAGPAPVTRTSRKRKP